MAGGIPLSLAAACAVSSRPKVVKRAFAFDRFNRVVSSYTVYVLFTGATMPFSLCTAQWTVGTSICLESTFWFESLGYFSPNRIERKDAYDFVELAPFVDGPS